VCEKERGFVPARARALLLLMWRRVHRQRTDTRAEQLCHCYDIRSVFTFAPDIAR
jgi:hypothetical protein